MNEKNVEWFVNENIILGIPDSKIKQEQTELIKECLDFLDEFIRLSNQSIITPFLTISVMMITTSIMGMEVPEESISTRGERIKWKDLINMCEKYGGSISEKTEKIIGSELLDIFFNFLGDKE